MCCLSCDLFAFLVSVLCASSSTELASICLARKARFVRLARFARESISLCGSSTLRGSRRSLVDFHLPVPVGNWKKKMLTETVKKHHSRSLAEQNRCCKRRFGSAGRHEGRCCAFFVQTAISNDQLKKISSSFCSAWLREW